MFITLPLIRSSIATNLMLVTLQTLAVFTLIWVMTAGGPSNASTTLPVLAYQEAFKFGDIGYGTAIASVLIVHGPGVRDCVRPAAQGGQTMTTAGRRTFDETSRRAGHSDGAAPGRRRGRGPADAALLLIGACFVLPLLWLVLAPSTPKRVTRPGCRPRLVSQLHSGPYAGAAAQAALEQPAALSRDSSVTLVAAVLAAYPLSRFESRFNRPFMYSILCGTCLPVTAIMVPVYGLFVQLRLLDSRRPRCFFMAATALPMAIWMTKNFMDAVPVSLEEAAWVDGASGLTALRAMVLPLMRPGLGVVFIFVFIQAWGNFFVPVHPAAVAVEAARIGFDLQLLRTARRNCLRPAGRILDPLFGSGPGPLRPRGAAGPADRLRLSGAMKG